MIVSENVLKWVMRLYPPMLFQRIWVIRFDKGFRGVKVKVNRSLFNTNYNHSIFGGTIYAAADPFYPLLFHQLLVKRGYKVRVWMKSAEVYFLKPGKKDLFFTIRISDEDIKEVEDVLNRGEKYTKFHPITMYDKNDELCVEAKCEIYIRNLEMAETKSSVSI